MNENEVVEQTENPKMYSQEELGGIVENRLSRERAKLRKEYDREIADYKELAEIAMAGTGAKSVSEVKDTLRGFYTDKGVPMPQRSEFSDKDIEILARADAEEYIQSGYDDVAEEVARLAAKGDAMTPREKARYQHLDDYRKKAELGRELAGIGVTEDVYNSKEFQKFAGQFNSNIPGKDIYDIYSKTIKKPIKTMGSMKSSAPETGVKDFYSFEEASKFSRKDLDKNPALYQAVRNSMSKW